MSRMRARRLLPLISLVACAALLVALVPRSRVQADEPPYFAIKNVRVVPVSGAPIDNATVVISKGLIAAVGANVTVPPEALVIDGKGLTVYPGLIDALSDLGIPSAAPAGPGGGGGGGGPNLQAGQQVQQRASRGPEDRPATTPWNSAANDLREDRRIETWRNGGFTSSHTAPRTGFFPGQGAIINLAGDPEEMVVRPGVSLMVNMQPTGGFGGGFPNSLMGAIAYIRQVFDDAQWWAAAQPVSDANPRAQGRIPYDRAERVIANALRNNLPVLVNANTCLQIRRALDIAPAWSPRIMLYGVQQAYECGGEIAAKKLPVLVSLRWPERQRDTDPEAIDPLRTLRFRDHAPSSPAALAKAGVKFAFYSDGTANPKDVLRNAKKAIDAGLTADAALRAFTLDAAELFGVADRLGSIETGKIANLVVADGPLFEERTRIKMVFVDGHKFDVKETEQPQRPQGGQQAPRANFAGTWRVSVETPQGPVDSTWTIAVGGDGNISGTVSSMMGTASISSGTLTGNQFTFSFSLNLGGDTQTVTFHGTIDGNSIKGTGSVADASLDFTGTRQGPGGSVAGEGN